MSIGLGGVPLVSRLMENPLFERNTDGYDFGSLSFCKQTDNLY